jgi:hypothetical protein
VVPVIPFIPSVAILSIDSLLLGCRESSSFKNVYDYSFTKENELEKNGF